MSTPSRPSFKTRLQQLHGASLPFVARTFRGNRFRRYAAGSILLGVLSVLMGIWLSFGTGEFEQDIRRGLDLEESHWDRDRIEFQVTAHDPYHYEMLLEEQRRLTAHGNVDDYSQLGSERERAYSTLYTALSIAPPRGQQALAARATALLEAYPPSRVEPQWHYAQDTRDWQFDWYAPAERQRLEAIIDRELQPKVVLYTSPLSVMDSVRLTGAVAGGFVVLLMLIVAPLSTGATVAQEVHENTLQPVLGTRLRPVDIVTGLAASGLALGGLLALPSLGVMLVAGLVGGYLAHMLPLLLLLPAATLLTVLLTALVGFGLGKRWSSGIVATVLTGVLCMLMLFSVGLGMNLEDEMVGLIAMLPPVGVVHELRELFVPGDNLRFGDTQHALVVVCVSVVAYTALAFVIGRALTRRVAGRTQPSLTRVEGFIAAATTMALAFAVLPDFKNNHAVEVYFVSLGLACVPWMLVLSGRVPVGDGPSSLRTIPLRTIMLELAAYVAGHAIIVTAIFGLGHIPFAPMGAFHLVWALAVMGLLAVRMVAVPTNILGSLFALLCLGAIAFEMVSAGVFVAAAVPDAYYRHAPHPFVLFEASAVLGLIQLALTVAIPLLLVRTLRKGSAGLA